MSYTKLDHSILTSTIWIESDPTRIAWFTFLALCDRHGEVHGSIPGLASIARIPVEDMRIAIDRLLSPDPDSRTTDHEGRRIQTIPGGWIMLNHAKYRDLDSGDDRRLKAAERQKRFRLREKEVRNSNSVTELQITPDLPPRSIHGGVPPTKGADTGDKQPHGEYPDIQVKGGKMVEALTGRARKNPDLRDLDAMKLIA